MNQFSMASLLYEAQDRPLRRYRNIYRKMCKYENYMKHGGLNTGEVPRMQSVQEILMP